MLRPTDEKLPAYLQQPELTKFCQDKGIVIEAYSPLGNNSTGELRTVDDPKVHEIAKSVGLDSGMHTNIPA